MAKSTSEMRNDAAGMWRTCEQYKGHQTKRVGGRGLIYLGTYLGRGSRGDIIERMWGSCGVVYWGGE